MVNSAISQKYNHINLQKNAVKDRKYLNKFQIQETIVCVYKELPFPKVKLTKHVLSCLTN